MKLLILGGTRFLGRHIAQQALDAGHHVTLLHRGQSGRDLFPQAEHRIADRDGDLAVLADGEWDSVIDTSAYVPRQVRSMAAVLSGRVGQYQLVSSISVYAGFDAAGNDEDAALATLEDLSTEAVDGKTYGGLKALCEQEAQRAFGPRCLRVRPGLIVGPHDPTGRYTWWVQRLQRGGDVLAPGRPDSPVQFIDARDLAGWQLLQAQRRTAGIFNLTGPNEPATLGEFFDASIAALDSDARLTWVDEAFLLDKGVAPWSDLPVWLPRESEGLHRTHIGRAIASGLRCRAMDETALDTAAWAATAPPPVLGGPMRPAVGLSAEREAELLAAWRSRSSS